MKNYYIAESGNKVEIVDKGIIDLSNQEITEVFISDLPNCRRIYLEKNNIELVDIDMPMCNSVFLHGNIIESIDLNLPECTELHLDNNEICSANLILPKCKVLHLDYNNLESIDLDLPECIRLFLDNNELESVELTLPKCDILNLDHNNFTFIELDLPECISLNLDNNSISSVKLSIPKCETLDLDINKLKSANVDLPECISLEADLTRFTQSNGDVIIGFDGLPTIIDSERKMGDFIIYKGRYKDRNDETFVASRGVYSAHGITMKKAIEDCNFKFLQATIDVTSYFAECKEKGTMSVSDYRLLTGACESGCNHFLESKDIDCQEMKFDDAMSLLEENKPYGWDEIKELI